MPSPASMRVIIRLRRMEEALVALHFAAERGDKAIVETLCKSIAYELGMAKIEAEDIG